MERNARNKKRIHDGTKRERETSVNEGKSRNGMIKKNGVWIPDNSDFSAAGYAAEMADRLDRRRRDRKINRIKMENQRRPH